MPSSSVVQVVVVVRGSGAPRGGSGKGAGGRRGCRGPADAALGELEVVAEAAGLLEGLREHLVLSDVVVRDGAARKLHRLLEVVARDLGDGVGRVLVHGRAAARSFSSSISFSIDS